MAVKKKTTKTGDEAVATAESEKSLTAARERFGEVVTGVEQRVQGLKDGAGKVSEKVKERAERASTVARERYEVARDGAREGYDKVTKDLDHLSQDASEYIRHNPGKSVAVALGVGFLLGILLRPRRD